MPEDDRPMMVDLLYQSEIWIDGQGVTHRIEQMSLRHVSNVRAYLIRMGRTLAGSLYFNAAHGMQPSGEVATDAYESMLDELLEAYGNPQPWLEKTPLIQALDKRLSEAGLKPVGTHEMSVVIRLKVPDDRDSNTVRRSLDEVLRGMKYEYEIGEFEEGR